MCKKIYIKVKRWCKHTQIFNNTFSAQSKPAEFLGIRSNLKTKLLQTLKFLGHINI